MTFPTDLDGFEDVQAGGLIRSATINALNTAAESLQSKVGVDDSTISTSLDYRVNHLEDARWVNVKDPAYGAVGDGVVDDTVAIQAAMDAAATPAGGSGGISGGTVFLPKGTYKITDTLTLDQSGLTMRGVGVGNATNYSPKPGGGTTIKWGGAAGSPMVMVTDDRLARFFDIRFQGDDTNPPSEGIYFESDTVQSIGTNKNCIIARCYFGVWTWVSGGPDGAMDYGVRMGGAINADNDKLRIQDSFFNECSVAGIAIDNSQSLWGMLDNCFIQRCAIGVRTSASISTYNIQFNHSGDVDVEVNGTAQFIAYGMWTEAAPLVFRCTSSGKFVAYGGKFQLGDEMTGGIWGDHQSCGGGGQVSLTDVWLDNTGASPAPVLKIRGSTSSSSGYVRIAGGIGFNLSGSSVANMDIAAGSGSGGLEVDINSRGLRISRKLTASLALPATDTGFGGTIHTNTTAVGNVGAGEDDLMSYTVPLNTLAATGAVLEFSAAGTFAATAANKQIKVKFGASQLLATGVLASALAGDWNIKGTIYRTGAATQKASTVFTCTYSDGSTVTVTDNTSPTATLASDNALKLTGEATNNNDISQEMSNVKWFPNK